jgi:putative membrane protein
LRKLKDYILLFVKGIGMGGADAIPGVSGGTIAFITGIYEELLHSLRSIDVEAIKLLGMLRIDAFWKKINGAFLISVFCGLLLSLISLAKLMVYLLGNYPIQVWSFFFGLILISSPLILRSIRKWNLATVVFFIAGIVIAYGITSLSPTQTPESLWFVFLSGGLAICAMILPGISGAFILLLLGKYEFIMQSLIHFNIHVIMVFCLGCIVGLISFSRFLSWILDKYHNITIALLAGFMLGSLNKVWPWKEVISYRLDAGGNQVPAMDRSVLPGEYMAKTANDPMVFKAIMLMALGVIIVIVIEKVAGRFKTKV